MTEKECNYGLAGVQNKSVQDVPLWHVELKTIKAQKMQEELLSPPDLVGRI